VKAIEYHPNGKLKRVEFHEEQAAELAPIEGNFDWTHRYVPAYTNNG
jgi:hypothetical protein